MNQGDIFQKSELGREEVKNQHSSSLPREARTLLIFIDGRKTYQQYVDLLDKGKMFADVGGIAPFFEMLRDLELIERFIVGDVDDSNDIVNESVPTTLETSDDGQNNVEPIDLIPAKPQSTDSNALDNTNDSNFDNFFNSRPAEPVTIDNTDNSGNSERQTANLNFEAVKSKLASYIERHAPAQDAWSHMLNLEQCSNAVELIAFIQEIQRTDNSELSHGINEFYTMLKQ